MRLELFVTEGLGDTSYLLASEGQAVLVDPQRDADRMLAAAGALGVDLRAVLETHVHNDYVSGALEVRAATGAEVAAPAGGGYEFPHRALREGDEIRVGDVRLVAIEAPGHTPEHLAYLVFEGTGERPVGVFTGGSLIVGNAGRSDLLGPERAEELARAQFRTLRRLAALDPETRVLPTHGAGSFCATGASSADRTSTIGRELASNPSLSAPDEASFVREHLWGLPAVPAYYRHMAPINRAGPSVAGSVATPPPLSARAFADLVREGRWVVDGRGRREFAAAHVPGSVNVELDDRFASYVGWAIPFGSPVALVLPEPAREHAEAAGRDLFRIGYDPPLGFLDGGIDAWRESGEATSAYPVVDTEDLCAAMRDGSVAAGGVLDVRQRPEWEAGHVPGSRHAFVGDLAERPESFLRDGGDRAGGAGPWWVACATGHRAALAASVLDRAGVAVRLVGRGGIARLLRTCPEVAGALT